jgi:hypothetical protein
LEPNPEENNVEAMTCAKCGKPILDRESSFCAYCGISFDSKSTSLGLTTATGILAIAAAVFSVAAGVIGLNYYQSYVTYYSTYGMDTSDSYGFLLFASFAFIAAAIGFAGGMLALAKKRFMVAVTGMLVMLASAAFTFVSLWHFGYGFLETLLLPGISIIAFSIISIVFAVKSRADFSHAELF